MQRIRNTAPVLMACLSLSALGCGQGKVEASPKTNADHLSSAAASSGALSLKPSSLCLTVDGTGDGAHIVQRACDGSNLQSWTLASPRNDGNYTVVNAQTGKCLDVPGGQTQNGVQLIEWNCWGGANQSWNLQDLGNGFSSLRSVGTGKCVDLPSGTSNSGARIQQWDCVGNDNQSLKVGQGGGTPSGGFRVSSGRILAPDGSEFIAKGINIYTGQVDIGTILGKFPGLNFIRLATSPGANAGDIASFVDAATSRKVVVEIEDHTSSGGNPNTSSGQALTDEANWFAGLASTYAQNPYVWFGTANEPDNTADLEAIAIQEAAIVNAVRSAGNPTVVMVEMRGGFTNDFARTYASYYSNMTNVVWDVHFYGWVTGWYQTNNSGQMSTDETTILNALRQEIADAQSVQTADGVPPIIVGEFGPSTTGKDGVDANGTQVVQAVLDSGKGFAAWAWNAGTDNLTDDSGNLTDFGSRTAARIAAP